MPDSRSTKSVHHIKKNDLRLLLDKSAHEMLNKLNKSDFGFEYFLEKRSYKGKEEEQILELVLTILSQVCSLREQRSKRPRLKHFLRMLKNCQTFLYDDVPRVINLSFSENANITLVSFIADYMNILTTLLQFFPSAKIVNEIFPAMENYVNRLRENKPRKLDCVEASFNALAGEKERYENPVSDGNDDDEDEEIDSFRNLSVVPCENDIVNYKIPYIPCNITDRPYRNVNHYLSVHYRLIREDMLRNFRECVKECMKSGPGISAINKNKIYENVSVVSPPEYTVGGICYKVMVTSSKEIDWAKKEALIPGSLVILTPDLFTSVVVATVKNNPRVHSGKSKKCEIIIKLEDDVLFKELPNKIYKMIEPAAYFECYKHVLLSIKAFTEVSLPLSDILAYLDYNDPHPEYLDGKKYCLHEKCGGLAEHNDSYDCKVFNPLKDNEWPTLEDLDEQQYLAFKTAITKKVAVIQGPPGTGKTHVGVKIVQTLLENETRKPIVICCLTNHALDHFLEGIMKHTKKVVRLGSQSKKDLIKPYELESLSYAARQYRQGNALDEAQEKSLNIVKNIANQVLNPKVYSFYDSEYEELKGLCNKINALIHEISLCTDKYLEDDALNKIIDSKFKNQLRNTPGSVKKNLSNSILEWLVCSHSSDLYDKCHKWFNYFEKKHIVMPRVKDVGGLTETKRFEVFYCWRKECLDIQHKTLQFDIEEYKKLMRIYDGRPVDYEKLEIVKGASIIGVTTTGASKYKDFLRQCEPHILIIEEAAQVLEAHVIASLVCSVQHLILIGDHEQLRPLPADHELSKHYKLEISMFERLFSMGAPSATLVSQRRMKPCIAELLVPYPYTQYTSHQSVYEYKEIRGVQSSVYFFNHKEFEDDNSSGTSSSNKFEAKMVVSLAKYLYLQSYSLEKITIIATYAAQVALIIKSLMEENLQIHVTTVDNFQGEENDIILISFVRSNPSAIGFLKESNRVCVALSRAKMGMFCFGNFELFSSKNDLWKNLVEKAREKNIIGDLLELKCEGHQTLHTVKSGEDIEKFIDSGCPQLCNFLLPCKHKCAHTCHFKDPDHLRYNCQQPCERMIDEQRVCPYLCYEKCKRVKRKEVELPCGHYGSSDAVLCFKEVQRILICKHIITVPCYVNMQQYKCEALINLDLPCGHTKRVPCHERFEKMNIVCTELRPQMGACGHNVYVPCSLHLSEDDLLPFCDKSCGSLLDCGHPCVKLCKECLDTGIHGLCNEMCEQILSCGHKCGGYCNRPCPPCAKKCKLSCAHETKCINECLRPCVKCKERCARTCKHYSCSKKCFEKCDVEPCMEPCSKILPCGHHCIGLCGDPCPYLCRLCHADYFDDDSTELHYVELECEDVIEIITLNEHIEDCLTTFDWPCCPKCSQVITQSVRYKEALMKAKSFCIDSWDTSEEVLEIQYLVDTMYGEANIPPALFLNIHNKIIKILKQKKPRSDSLVILKNCVVFLKKLVIIEPKLDLADEYIQGKFHTLLIWISDHLTIASFQQLREFESAVELLSNKIAYKVYGAVNTDHLAI